MEEPKSKKAGKARSKEKAVLQSSGNLAEETYLGRLGPASLKSERTGYARGSEAATRMPLPPGFRYDDPDAVDDMLFDMIRANGFEVPDDLSSLRQEESAALETTARRMLAELGLDWLGDSVVARMRARTALSEEARPERDPDKGASGSDEKGKERAIMALADVVTAAEGFRQAVEEGRLSCDDLPYVARKKLSEIFRSLDGQDFGDGGREAELKAQLATQQEEILRLRGTSPKFDHELAALENEVAAMLEEGRPPEAYSDRADRSEKALEFLQRVYGRYLEKGREAIYLDEIRKLDPKFVNVLAVTCNKSGVDVSGLVPLRTDRTERVMERVVESVGSTVTAKATKAMHAVKMRNYRK